MSHDQLRASVGTKLVRKLLTLPEVAEIIGVSVHTVYAWRQTGDAPPAIKVGRHLRFDPVDLMEWLDSKKEIAPRPHESGSRS